jgi:hypothetical protein
MDILQNKLSDKLTLPTVLGIIRQYLVLYSKLQRNEKITEAHKKHMRQLEKILLNVLRFGLDFPIKRQIVNLNIQQQNSRYTRITPTKRTDRQINKTKVRNKMYALFNLKSSRNFMAFYSVSFPAGTSDDICFKLWNYWLTACRKRFYLTNYVWVSERQKNGTLHYHMITNNWLPIQNINKIMAIQINNQVLAGCMSWGEPQVKERSVTINGQTVKEQYKTQPCMENYNGVDVDAIYGSKRHQKTGKYINPAQLRQWLSCYITKYVTKNSEKFTHLCWHCSRSVSLLFTSQLIEFEKRLPVTMLLPSDKNMYLNFKSDFNHTCVFKFIPSELLFNKIKYFNDLVNAEFETKLQKSYKSKQDYLKRSA